MPKNILIFDFPFRSMYTHTISSLQWICQQQCVFTTLPKTAEKVTFWLPSAMWRRLGAVDLLSSSVLQDTVISAELSCVLTVVWLTWMEPSTSAGRLISPAVISELVANRCVFVPKHLQKHNKGILNLMIGAFLFLFLSSPSRSSAVTWVECWESSPVRNDISTVGDGVKPQPGWSEGMCLMPALKFFVLSDLRCRLLAWCSSQTDAHVVFWFVVQDESRIKATVMEVKPVDHKDYSKRLIMNIRKLAAQWTSDIWVFFFCLYSKRTALCVKS